MHFNLKKHLSQNLKEKMMGKKTIFEHCNPRLRLTYKTKSKGIENTQNMKHNLFTIHMLMSTEN